MARNDDDDQLEEEPEETPAEEPADEEPAAQEEFEEKKPRPKVTALTMILCVLNVLAALGFVYLLMMDYSKRQAWSYAVFKHDFALMGLPLEEEATGTSASRVTMPRQHLDPDQLKAAASQRGVRGEAFQPVELILQHPILPQHLKDQEILKDLFKNVGEPVTTLQDEVARLKKALPQEIAGAGEGAALGLKTDDDKRKRLERILLPLAYSPSQIDAVDKKIKELPADKLDTALKDAVQRRMLVDILTSLEDQRPAEFKDRSLEKVVEVDAVPLDRLFDLLQRRFDEASAGKYDPTLFFGQEWANEKRESIDKRHAIAFLLTVLAQAKKPDGSGYACETPDRAQTVVGLHEYALAAQKLTGSLVAQADRVIDSIRIDRDGALFSSPQLPAGGLKDKDGKPLPDEVKVIYGKPTPIKVGGFVSAYQAEIARLRTLVDIIKKQQGRLEDIQDQLEKQKTILADRTKLVEEVTAKLLKSRQVTAGMMKELDQLNAQFFQAKVQLRDAQLQNVRREQDIARWENFQPDRKKKKGP